MRIVRIAWGVAAALLAISCTGVSSAREAPAVSASHNLVGTWRLISFENFRSGKWEAPYGENPRGYFVYDPTGRVSIHIMKMPRLAADGFGRGATPSVEQKAAAYDAYVGYFGTYTVDAARGIVVHHVEGSLDPSYTDTDQPRPFVLAGDTLIIGDQTTWKRTLRRVKG
jgi:hypothetical protein